MGHGRRFARRIGAGAVGRADARAAVARLDVGQPQRGTARGTGGSILERVARRTAEHAATSRPLEITTVENDGDEPEADRAAYRRDACATSNAGRLRGADRIARAWRGLVARSHARRSPSTRRRSSVDIQQTPAAAARALSRQAVEMEAAGEARGLGTTALRHDRQALRHRARVLRLQPGRTGRSGFRSAR